MKQKIILTTLFLTIFSLVVFVSAVNPPSLPGETTKDIPGYGSITGNYVESSFKFMNGWNLVHGLPNPEWLSGGDIEASNIKAIYGFNPITQEYIRFYPEPEKSKLSSQNTRVDSMISATAFWVYIDSPTEYGESEYWTLEPNVELNKQMVEGWNFVSFLPNYVGKSFDELEGNCDIQKLYWWQPRSQQFNNILSDKDRMEVLRYSENIGSGLLIKVPESCILFASSSDSSDVPNIPEIPNIKSGEGGEELKILYEAIPVSSIHSLIPSGLNPTSTEDVLQKINKSEGNYLDENFYVHIPGGDHENVNAHDSIEINFQLPSDLISEENELFVKVNLACGDYGEIFIKSSNKFGDFNTLERVKCETENWEEKEIIVSSGSVWTETPVIVFKRDGGRGQVKVDSVEVFVKG
jgi:hypothetical protein